MSPRTCDYVAKKSEPESWHGTESSTYYLDLDRVRGGLGISEWHCPHPPLEQTNDNDNCDQYCIFHTDPKDTPDDVDESKALLKEIEHANSGSQSDRPEHRGQFVGATFGTIDLSGETIEATDQYDIRFDHARFQTDDADLNFRDAKFRTVGQYPISFIQTEFSTAGEGDVSFSNAEFQTAGEGDVRFNKANFKTVGEGSVEFIKTTFRTDSVGDVRFEKAIFQTNSEGHVGFDGVTFRTDSEGHLNFIQATFRTDGHGSVWFNESTFEAVGEGHVGFIESTFEAAGEGHVGFPGATFEAAGEGNVGFDGATFEAAGEGNVVFDGATLFNPDFRSVDFSEAEFHHVDLTGVDLREANIANISVNGATVCDRLYEGYVDRPSTGRSFISGRLRNLYRESTFSDDDKAWDATARAYHDLKNVFREHGLIGKARKMHVRERRARSLEARAANGWSDVRYLRSLPSRVFTGYGVEYQKLLIWMGLLFIFSTVVYMSADVRGGLTQNISYSVLAFTVAPPSVPDGVGTQLIMMVETFFGTLSIVLLGYILGNRERF